MIKLLTNLNWILWTKRRIFIACDKSRELFENSNNIKFTNENDSEWIAKAKVDLKNNRIFDLHKKSHKFLDDIVYYIRNNI